MSKQRYDNETIARYLLGSLPEAEAEALDELSLTDDEFADSLMAAEKDLVDAYVQGELSGAELERFKTYYLASPLRREKVQFARAFQVFAEKGAVAQAAAVEAEIPAEVAERRKTAGWFFGPGVLKTKRRALRWGAAFAALALLVACAWLVLENRRLRQRASQIEARPDVPTAREQELQKELEGQREAYATAAQELARVREERARLEQELKGEQERQRLAEQQRAAGQQSPPSQGGASIVSFILAPQMRGVEQPPTVSVPAQTDYVAMQLRLEPNDYPAYRVSLLDQSGNRTLWRSNKLKARAGENGQALGVSFRAGLLGPQTYVLRVYGVSAAGTPEVLSDYPFKVVK
ncbi:MAG TPA: hypothetical protein VJ715_17545 [Pyrinomonadaceae bacterium]|nr:hypothetical protein [Pyrinomonadaceae bacterium]